MEKAQNCYHLENDKEKAKDYYENNKERLQERVRNKFSNEEKVMKREYGRNRNRKMLKEKKKVLF